MAEQLPSSKVWHSCAICGLDIAWMAYGTWLHVLTKSVYCQPIKYATPRLPSGRGSSDV